MAASWLTAQHCAKVQGPPCLYVTWSAHDLYQGVMEGLLFHGLTELCIYITYQDDPCGQLV